MSNSSRVTHIIGTCSDQAAVHRALKVVFETFNRPHRKNEGEEGIICGMIDWIDAKLGDLPQAGAQVITSMWLGQLADYSRTLELAPTHIAVRTPVHDVAIRLSGLDGQYDVRVDFGSTASPSRANTLMELWEKRGVNFTREESA